MRLRICLKNLPNSEPASSFFRSDGLAPNSRFSYHTGYVPTCPGNGDRSPSVDEKCHQGDSRHGGGCGHQSWEQSHAPGKEHPTPVADDLMKYGNGTVVSKLPEQGFEPLDSRIWFARSIPQIVVIPGQWFVLRFVVP